MNTGTFPVVTVVTVCFNLLKNERRSCFAQCLSSVQRQDYPNIEHLVIDGASQDGTVGMLREYEQKGYLRLISEPDSGIYDAMNKGIRQARGKYVVFLNSDDFWHDEKAVSASVEALERTDAAFSYAPRTIVREDGSFLCTESAALGVFPCLMPFCHQTMFTRRDVLQQMQGFDSLRYRSAADYELVLRILLNGFRGVYVPLNFTSFRLGGFSAEDTLSQCECRAARSRLLGEDSAAMLESGCVDDDLWNRLSEMVHSSVALDMVRCFTPDGPGRYRVAYNLARQYAGNNQPVAGCIINKHCVDWRLFRVIPLLRIKMRPTRTDVLLLCFLPLLRIRNRGRRRAYYLFWLIPFLYSKAW